MLPLNINHNHPQNSLLHGKKNTLNILVKKKADLRLNLARKNGIVESELLSGKYTLL